MTTILLDLDNTLLGNDMRQFLPPYFVALQQHLSRWFDSHQDLQQAMFASVQVMQANEEPAASNMSVFTTDFSQRIGCSPDDLILIMETFYRENFPRLRQYVTPRPEAAELVRHLLEAGQQVVIATNPLFPAAAIEQRLTWAGVADFSYALVTTMENSSFSKPNPRYYQEILDKIGGTPESAWMVGDDPLNDIAPARSVGLKTWWITDAVTPADDAPATDQQGTLADFLAWVERGRLS